MAVPQLLTPLSVSEWIVPSLKDAYSADPASAGGDANWLPFEYDHEKAPAVVQLWMVPPEFRNSFPPSTMTRSICPPTVVWCQFTAPVAAFTDHSSPLWSPKYAAPPATAGAPKMRPLAVTGKPATVAPSVSLKAYSLLSFEPA